MLTLTAAVHDEMVAACLAGYPLEACGLLGGSTGAHDATALHCWSTHNAAASARVYTVEPRDMLRVDREAEAAGVEVVGVWHSHTHTEAYPSATDVASAPDPGWWYVLVSLRDIDAVVRAYRIRDGAVEEVPVAVQ